MRSPAIDADMALEGSGRFVSYDKSRRLIYVSKAVVDDSTFPFKPGEELVVRIDAKNQRLIVERKK